MISKYKKNITIYGNTEHKKLFNLKYVNIPLKKKILSSRSQRYVKEFLNIEKRNQNIRDDILEMNNMNPSYTRQAQGEWERGKERHSETTSTKK